MTKVIAKISQTIFSSHIVGGSVWYFHSQIVVYFLWDKQKELLC